MLLVPGPPRQGTIQIHATLVIPPVEEATVFFYETGDLALAAYDDNEDESDLDLDPDEDDEWDDDEDDDDGWDDEDDDEDEDWDDED